MTLVCKDLVKIMQILIIIITGLLIRDYAIQIIQLDVIQEH